MRMLISWLYPWVFILQVVAMRLENGMLKNLETMARTWVPLFVGGRACSRPTKTFSEAARQQTTYNRRHKRGTKRGFCSIEALNHTKAPSDQQPACLCVLGSRIGGTTRAAPGQGAGLSDELLVGVSRFY